MSKGDQLEILLNESKGIHSSMEMLFYKNNVAVFELKLLPEYDFDSWMALHSESNKVSKQICDLILAK